MRLFKRVNDRWVAGICGGLAYKLGLPVWLVRLAAFVSIVIYGTGLGLYLLIWLFAPTWSKDPSDYDEVTGGG